MPEMTYRDAIRQALREELINDKRVFLLGEDIAEFGGSLKVTLGLLDEFGPVRIRNTPMSELAIVGAAVVAAATGTRPIAEIMFSDFLGLAMDQIFNQAAKMRYMFGGKLSIPMVIRTPMGGRRAAAAHHSQCLEAWFMHVPGIKIAIPSNAYDAKGLLKTAVRDPNPVMFFENKMLYNVSDEVPAEPYLIPFGVANVVRQGTDITIVAISDMVDYALQAAMALEAEGISAEVIDPRTLAPLDTDTIVNSVKKTGKLVIAHEACITGGIGAEIAAKVGNLAFSYLEAPIERVAAKDSPIPFSPILEKEILPDNTDVVEAVHRIMVFAG
jgi:pyruvate/2-oxoglutarate/acetoin dehydrogenase E1 component